MIQKPGRLYDQVQFDVTPNSSLVRIPSESSGISGPEQRTEDAPPTSDRNWFSSSQRLSSEDSAAAFEQSISQDDEPISYAGIGSIAFILLKQIVMKTLEWLQIRLPESQVEQRS